MSIGGKSRIQPSHRSLFSRRRWKPVSHLQRNQPSDWFSTYMFPCQTPLGRTVFPEFSRQNIPKSNHALSSHLFRAEVTHRLRFGLQLFLELVCPRGLFLCPVNLVVVRQNRYRCAFPRSRSKQGLTANKRKAKKQRIRVCSGHQRFSTPDFREPAFKAFRAFSRFREKHPNYLHRHGRLSLSLPSPENPVSCSQNAQTVGSCRDADSTPPPPTVFLS